MDEDCECCGCDLTHKIEVFTADCPLCLDTLEAVKEATKDCGCNVIEYKCDGVECCDEAKNYDIKAVPTIVVDGKIVHVGKLSAEDFKKYL